ncbi:hypothetical protein [Allorhizocola rhizosphaerae]|uniref:hypothetical protein n=1 Tax=Allorhizocola rhizosphaerae TaxID=1872709 RepID=UPI000E3CB12B|nr:hypothetical protein [Allorhizocola rhizosphaerae]
MRFWPRVFAVAFGTAALIGAAQLGLVYGLEAVRFNRPFAGVENDWNIHLTWMAWFAMTAVVGGTAFALGHAKLIARRQGIESRHSDGRGVFVRIVAALAAGLGGLLSVVPLTVYPAVNAILPTPHNPEYTMALTGIAAVVAGTILAATTAGNRPLSTSIAWFVAAAWVVAAASLSDTSPAKGRLYTEPVRLGVLDIGALMPTPRAHFSMPALALVIGLIVAVTGWVRRQSRVLIALSGATGPLLIALAYLMGGPGISRQMTNQADAYLGAMASVVVGLIPAIIVALLPKRAHQTL